MTELSLFCQSESTDFSGKLLEKESVFCIGGSRNEVFVGTDFGRLFRFRWSDEKYKLIESRQFPSKKAITSIELASALNYLLVVCGYEFLTVALDDFRITPAFSDVTRLAVNVNPTTDDPFSVPIACALGRKGILLVEVTKRASSKKKFQHDTPMPVRNLAFSRNTICYALEHHYFALNIGSKQVIRLFQHDCPTPTIAPTGPDEFLVRSSAGLAIFVNGDGTSSKPPFRLSTTQGPVFFKEPYIISCDRSKVAIQDCFVQRAEEFPFKRIDAGNYIEGQVLVVANRSQLYHIGETPPELTVDLYVQIKLLQVDSLMERKQYTQAIEILKKSLSGRHDEELARKLAECCENGAIEAIKVGNFNEAKNNFLTFTMNINDILEKINGQRDEIGDNVNPFIKHFLMSIRMDSNFSSQKQIVDLELLDVCYKLKCQEELDEIQEFAPEPTKAAEIYVRNNEIRLAAELLFDSQKYIEAFPLFVRVSIIHDASHLRPLLFKIKRLKENSALIPFLSLLAPFFPNEIMQILSTSSYSVYDAQYILRGLSTWEDYLDNQTMYDDIIVELVVVLISQIENGDKSKRIKLRQLILNMEPTLIDIIKVFLDSENLNVEKLLTEARKNPTSVLNDLLYKYKDFESAELLSAKYAKSYPEVALRLLKAYLEDKEGNTSANRIGRLLAHVGSNLNPEELLQKLPNDMTIQELSTFLKSTVINKTEATYASELSLAAAEKLCDDSKSPKEQRNVRVELTDTSQCPVCKLSLSYGEQLIILPTGFIVHSRCFKNPHLCPVTNALF